MALISKKSYGRTKQTTRTRSNRNQTSSQNKLEIYLDCGGVRFGGWRGNMVAV
jgi:hypothetical protein